MISDNPVPKSSIRSPGSLLDNIKATIDSKAQQSSTRNSINLQSYTNTGASFLESEADVFQFVNVEESEIIEDETDPIDNSLRTLSSMSTISPGKLKSSTDNVFSLIKKAKTLYLLYGIDLTIDMPKSSLKDIDELLSVLISEIVSFSPSFIGKLKILQLLIIEGSYFSDSSIKENTFTLSLLDAKEKILYRFYEILYHYIVTNKPQLLQEWAVNESQQRRDKSANHSYYPMSLKAAFITVMTDTCHSLLKSKKNRLVELMVRYHPEDLSIEWFKMRIKDKKKNLKVQFDINKE